MREGCVQLINQGVNYQLINQGVNYHSNTQPNIFTELFCHSL